MASSPIRWGNRWGNNGISDRLYFLGSKITVDGDCNHEIKRWLLLVRKAMINLDSVLKSRDISLPTKVLSNQRYGFSRSHVWMWELDHKEGWAPKSWCFRTVGLEKTLESPLDSKEIKLVNPKGSQLWIFIGRTDGEAPTLLPPDAKSQLTEKDPDAGKDLRTEEEEGDRRWDGWMASLTQRTWVWANCGR